MWGYDLLLPGIHLLVSIDPKRWIEACPRGLFLCFQLFSEILQSWSEQPGHLNKKEAITRRPDWSFWGRSSNVRQATGGRNGCILKALYWVYVCLHCCVFLWMSLFPDVGENIDVWSFLLLGILQLGVCVWGGDVGLFCSAYHTSSIPEHSFSSI